MAKSDRAGMPPGSLLIDLDLQPSEGIVCRDFCRENGKAAGN